MSALFTIHGLLGGAVPVSGAIRNARNHPMSASAIEMPAAASAHPKCALHRLTDVAKNASRDAPKRIRLMGGMYHDQD